jgi:hypothetical protein
MLISLLKHLKILLWPFFLVVRMVYLGHLQILDL